MDAEQLSRELSYKAMTAVMTLAQDHQRGLISKAQVATGCRAIFDSVSGLVAPNVLELISNASEEYKEKGVEVHIVRHQGQLKGTIRFCGSAKVVSFEGRALYNGANRDEPDLAARIVSDKYVEQILKEPE